MKATKRLWDDKERKWKEGEFDICDVAGTLLEEGQTVWYARANKSAASELFKGTVVKITPKSVSVKYEERYSWRKDNTVVGKLTTCWLDEGQCRYHQIVVVNE